MKMRVVPIQFVVVVSALLALPCLGEAASKSKGLQPGEVAPGVRQLGALSDRRITESSGLVASRKYPNYFWTHNDGGGLKRQVLYAIDKAGTTRNAFSIVGTEMKDWEDIATDGAGHLYLGDIGNNDAKRTELVVHQIDEPNPEQPVIITTQRTWRLMFPDAPFDCESLFIWGGHGYVVSKVFNDARAQIYKFDLRDTAEKQTLELVATTKVESPVTGASLSADGALLALVAKNGAYVQRIDGDPSRASKGRVHHTKFKNEHIEACTFVPEGLMVTSEDREIFLFTDEAFRKGPAPKAKAETP